MAVAASGKGGLMLRVDPSLADSLVDGVHVDRFEMHGRRMGGWQMCIRDRVFPAAIVQTCVIHLIRGTFRYASKRYWEALAKDMRAIYTLSLIHI